MAVVASEQSGFVRLGGTVFPSSGWCPLRGMCSWVAALFCAKEDARLDEEEEARLFALGRSIRGRAVRRAPVM